MKSLVDVLTTNSKALDLGKEVEVLEALVQLKESWDSYKESLDEFTLRSAFDFVDKLPQDDALYNAISALGADGDSLKAKATLVSEYLGRIPDEYRKLLQPISDFDEELSGTNPGLVDWEIFDLGKDGEIDSTYTFDIGASSRLSLEAGDGWPKSDESMPDPLLRMGFSGELSADGGASFPLTFGSLKVGSENRASSSINYFFDTGGSQSLYATAVAKNLGQLCNPFSLKGCWPSLVGSELSGIIAEIDGSSSLEVKVGVAEGFTIADELAQANVELTFGVKVGLDGSYELLLRNTSTSTTDSIEIVIARKNAHSRGAALGLGVTVDLAGLAARIRKLLEKHLGDYQEILEDFEEFLSPGTYIRDQAEGLLNDAVTDLTSDGNIVDALKDIIQAALGLDTKPNVTKLRAVLKNQIVEAIDSTGEVISSSPSAVASEIARTIAASLGMRETDLQVLLDEQLVKMIQGVKEGLKTKIGGLTDPQLKKLAERLEEIGTGVSAAVATANDALSGVRDVIGMYETLLKKMITATEQAARTKVIAKLSKEWSMSSGSIIEASVDISRLTPATEQAFKTLISGNFSGILELLSSNVPGLTFNPEKTALTRFATYQEKFGFELVLLGFELGSASIFDAEAKVISDATGRVSVMSKGVWTRRINTPREKRELKFIDAFELAAAKSTRQFALNLDISHQDEHLKRREVVDFLQSFEDASLVAMGTVERASNLFDAWSAADDDQIIKADINLTLTLESKAALRVMRQSERVNGDLSDNARRNVFQFAMMELIESGAYDLDDLKKWAKAALEQAEMAELGESKPIVDIFYEYTSRIHERLIGSPDLSPTFHSKRIRDLKRAARFHTLCRGLVDFVDTMGDIYDATPAFDSGDGWTRNDYLDAQKLLNGSIRKWLKLKKKWLFWIGDEAHPRMVAFVGALLAMSEAESLDGQPAKLSVTMVRRDGIGGTVVLV